MQNCSVFMRRDSEERERESIESAGSEVESPGRMEISGVSAANVFPCKPRLNACVTTTGSSQYGLFKD